MTTDPKEFDTWAIAVLDAATAHRDMATERGFSTEAAEAMAVSFHSLLIASIYDEVDGTDETN